MGAVAGFCTIVGMGILTTAAVPSGRSSRDHPMDKAMYVVLGTVIVLGLANTVIANIFGHYDYRDGVSIWFRGIFGSARTPNSWPRPRSAFKLHGLAAFALFALWPFTRSSRLQRPAGLPHPPYIVYRSRDERPRQPRATPRLGEGSADHDPHLTNELAAGVPAPEEVAADGTRRAVGPLYCSCFECATRPSRARRTLRLQGLPGCPGDGVVARGRGKQVDLAGDCPANRRGHRASRRGR